MLDQSMFVRCSCWRVNLPMIAPDRVRTGLGIFALWMNCYYNKDDQELCLSMYFMFMIKEQLFLEPDWHLGSAGFLFKNKFYSARDYYSSLLCLEVILWSKLRLQRGEFRNREQMLICSRPKPKPSSRGRKMGVLMMVVLFRTSLDGSIFR